MENKDKILKELEKFGLLRNQALIYLYLIQNGELRIQEIAGGTNIPRSSVYENLKVLSDLGLIEKIVDSNFVKVKSYPIGSLKHILNAKVLYTKSLINDLRLLEDDIASLPQKNTTTSSQVRYYKGRAGAQQLFWNTLNSKSTVFIYSAYGRSKFVGKNFYSDFVQLSGEKSIAEKVLINPTKNALSLIKKETNTPFARTKINDLKFLPESDILIKGETFIYDDIYSQVNLNAMEINGFEVESENFSNMQRSIFETLWNSAKPVKQLL